MDRSPRRPCLETRAPRLDPRAAGSCGSNVSAIIKMDVFSYVKTPVGFPAGHLPARSRYRTVPRANDAPASGSRAQRELASLPRDRFRSVAGEERRPRCGRQRRFQRCHRPSARSRPLGLLSPTSSSPPRDADLSQAHSAWHMACIPSGDRSDGHRPRILQLPSCPSGPDPSMDFRLEPSAVRTSLLETVAGSAAGAEAYSCASVPSCASGQWANVFSRRRAHVSAPAGPVLSRAPLPRSRGILPPASEDGLVFP